MNVFTETIITGAFALVGITLIAFSIRLFSGKSITSALFNWLAPSFILFTMLVFIWVRIGYFQNLPGTIILVSIALAIILVDFLLMDRYFVRKLQKTGDNFFEPTKKVNMSMSIEQTAKSLGAAASTSAPEFSQKGNKLKSFFRKSFFSAAVILIVAAAGVYLWMKQSTVAVPVGFALGNGRIEATEIEIATKLPGRLAEVMVREGDTIEAGQVLARMDTIVLEAQLKEAQAMVRQAKQLKKSSASLIAGKASMTKLASKEFERSSRLVERGSVSRQRYDYDETNLQRSKAEHSAAVSQLGEAQAAIEAAEARVDRLKAEIKDSLLVSPRKGRVLSRMAEPGEILPAGGKVLTVIDMDDIYMTLFLPGKDAGAIALGADARVFLDGLPQRPFPAKTTYISNKAQFTPREVETREERQKLVFRVKVSLTEKDDPRLKPGMTGITYIRLNPFASWPSSIK